jgi:hypothetical protein
MVPVFAQVVGVFDTKVVEGVVRRGHVFPGWGRRNSDCQLRLAEKSDSVMHEVIIASTFLAMLIVPCLAALQNEVSSGDAE